MKRSLIIALLCAVSIFAGGCASLPIGQHAGEAGKPNKYQDMYKRIQYVQEGQFRKIKVYYATCRQVEPKADGDLDFLPKMGDKVTGGEIDIKVKPGIKIGKMLPKRLIRKDKITIQDGTHVSEDELVTELKKAVAASPHKSLLVLVFGFKDDPDAVAIKAAYFSYMLDVNTPVLLFDWPGNFGLSVEGYMKAQRMAKETGPYLGYLLAKIEREVKPEKVWIQSSSLGCQVLCDAFDTMFREPDLSDPEAEISHVFMAAPDVGKDEFDMDFKKEISALSDGLTVYVSSNDFALLVSGILNDDRRLGRQNIKKEPPQLEEARELLYLKSQDPDKIAVIDVTPINRATEQHGYYLEDPQYFDDVYLRMLSPKPHANRRVYLINFKDGTDYWVMK